MNLRMQWSLALCASLVVVAGCPSYATFHSTKTAPAGQFEWSAGVSKSLAGETTIEKVKTDFVFMGRIGLTKNLDIGLRFRSDFVAGADIKFRFLDGERLQMALAPGFYMSVLAPALNGMARFAERMLDQEEELTSAFAYEMHVPLLFGIPFQENVFIFGPKLSFTNWNASVRDPTAFLPQGVQIGAMLWHPGVVLGLDWQVSPALRLLPEINVHFDFYGSVFVHAGIAAFL